MDLQRLFLFLIFAFSLVLVWDGWQRYQHPEQYVQQESVLDKEQAKSGLPSAVAQAAPAQQAAHPEARTIRVKTDLFEAEISSIGGDISRLALLEHPDSKDQSKPLVLFERGAGTH